MMGGKLMISVNFSAFLEDEEEPFFKEEEFLAQDWADCSANAEALASDIGESLISPDNWPDMFGDDENSASIIIVIHSPETVAGWYKVDLERVVKASATRSDEK